MKYRKSESLLTSAWLVEQSYRRVWHRLLEPPLPASTHHCHCSCWQLCSLCFHKLSPPFSIFFNILIKEITAALIAPYPHVTFPYAESIHHITSTCMAPAPQGWGALPWFAFFSYCGTKVFHLIQLRCKTKSKQSSLLNILSQDSFLLIKIIIWRKKTKTKHIHQSFALARIKNNSFEVRIKSCRGKTQAQSLSRWNHKLLKPKMCCVRLGL